jgi:hypothetical protein
MAWREGKIASDDARRRVTPFEEADAARVRYLQIGIGDRRLRSDKWQSGHWDGVSSIEPDAHLIGGDLRSIAHRNYQLMEW